MTQASVAKGPNSSPAAQLAVFEALAERPMTAVELCQITGYSNLYVRLVLSHMAERNEVSSSVAEVPGKSGRPPLLFRLKTCAEVRAAASVSEA